MVGWWGVGRSIAKTRKQDEKGKRSSVSEGLVFVCYKIKIFSFREGELIPPTSKG